MDWFFKIVDKGIVFEDDIQITHESLNFFNYWLAKTDEYVISAFSIPETSKPWLSKHGSVWGWACNGKIWKSYRENLDKKFKFKALRSFESFKEFFVLLTWFFQSNLKRIDTWDFDWNLYRRANNIYTVMPPKSLVTNIGFSSKGTHTKTDIPYWMPSIMNISDLDIERTQALGAENRLSTMTAGQEARATETNRALQERATSAQIAGQQERQIGLRGQEERAILRTQGTESRDLRRTEGQQTRLTEQRRGLEQRAGIRETGLQDRLGQVEAGRQQRAGIRTTGQEQRASTRVTGEEERAGIRTTGQETRATTRVTGQEQRAGIRTTGEQDRALRRTSGEETRATTRVTGEEQRAGIRTTGQEERATVSRTAAEQRSTELQREMFRRYKENRDFEQARGSYRV